MSQNEPKSDQDLSDLLVKAALSDPKITTPGFDSSRVFALVSVLLHSPSVPTKKLIRSLGTIYNFHLTSEEQGERVWNVDMKKKGRVTLLDKGARAPSKPDVSIWMSDKDFVGLSTGRLNPQKLYAAKRIRVRGDIDRALRVEKLLTSERKKLEALADGAVKSDAEPKERGRWASVKSKVKAKL